MDDLNDWIEPLGGHPQAHTPHLSRLAREAVTFTRSYCASPGCNPSRTALLTGLACTTSGVYSNYQYWREVLPDAVTLPRAFSDRGYWSAGAGKIFHNDQADPGSWDAYFPSLERHMPGYLHPGERGTTVSMPRFENMYVSFDWSPLDAGIEETGDCRSVDWVAERLGREAPRSEEHLARDRRPHQAHELGEPAVAIAESELRRRDPEFRVG